MLKGISMKIDAHQHFWSYSSKEYGWITDDMSVLKRDYLPADLQKELSINGIDGSIAVQARQSLQETEWLIQLAEQNEFIKGVVGWLDIQDQTFKHQLEKYSRPRPMRWLLPETERPSPIAPVRHWKIWNLSSFIPPAFINWAS